ncbi:MAG: DUF1835 domain-containing protein [Bradyrhizobium sp.]
MTQTTAHFVFTLSGGGCLVRALRSAGRDDQVVVTSHGFNVGPIDPSDPSARAKWLEIELGRIDPKDAARSERSWDETRFPGHRKVAWLTQRSAVEYAAFLTGCGTGTTPRATWSIWAKLKFPTLRHTARRHRWLRP